MAALFLIVGTMGVQSCSEDKDVPFDDSIVGTWSYVVSDNSWYEKNEVGISYTFKSDRKVTCRMLVYKYGIKTKDKEYNFTYEFDGKVLTLKDSSGDQTSYNVSINGNKLTMDGNTYTKQ